MKQLLIIISANTASRATKGFITRRCRPVIMSFHGCAGLLYDKTSATSGVVTSRKCLGVRASSLHATTREVRGIITAPMDSTPIVRLRCPGVTALGALRVESGQRCFKRSRTIYARVRKGELASICPRKDFGEGARNTTGATERPINDFALAPHQPRRRRTTAARCNIDQTACPVVARDHLRQRRWRARWSATPAAASNAISRLRSNGDLDDGQLILSSYGE